jgi:hypothetical protein
MGERFSGVEAIFLGCLLLDCFKEVFVYELEIAGPGVVLKRRVVTADFHELYSLAEREISPALHHPREVAGVHAQSLSYGLAGLAGQLNAQDHGFQRVFALLNQRPIR